MTNDKKMIRNKILIFMFIVTFTIGCQNITSENDSQENQANQTVQVEEVENYLVAHLGQVAFGGQVFCAYDILATEQTRDVTIFYLWVLCQEFYQEQQQLKQGTGISLPVALTLENQGGNWQILEHKIPRDGLSYGEEIEAIFPQPIWSQISPSNNQEIKDYNNRIDILENATEEKATVYFALEE